MQEKNNSDDMGIGLNKVGSRDIPDILIEGQKNPFVIRYQ
jgi:hypothetical protein